jgi:uncharacterized membrane protein SirB2
LYSLLKVIHVSAVAISGAGLLLRFALIQANSSAIHNAFVRIAPHVVDTVLLASAIALFALAGLNPLATSWLAAKIVAVALYIVAGTIALRGQPRLRGLALVIAIAVYCYIVGVAIAKHPIPWISVS